jgi:hypothetical protein
MDKLDRCRRALLVIMVALTAGCTGVAVDPFGLDIVEDVSPIKPMEINRVCVKVNTGVKQAFTDGVFAAVQSTGLKTQSMQTAFAGECPYWLSYDATWDGFPAYLVTAHVEVYKGSTKLGHVIYDARRGGGRPDRYGSAVAKVRPLIEGMFHHVQREAAPAE